MLSFFSFDIIKAETDVILNVKKRLIKTSLGNKIKLKLRDKIQLYSQTFIWRFLIGS